MNHYSNVSISVSLNPITNKKWKDATQPDGSTQPIYTTDWSREHASINSNDSSRAAAAAADSTMI